MPQASKGQTARALGLEGAVEQASPSEPVSPETAVAAAQDVAEGVVIPAGHLPYTATLNDYMTRQAIGDGDDTAAAWESILRDVMTADSVMDLLADSEAIHAEDIVNRAIKVHGVEFRKSDFGGEMPFYAVMDVEFEHNGERAAVTIGARRALAQLMRADTKGWFPMTCRVIRSERPTAAGNYPMWLGHPLT